LGRKKLAKKVFFKAKKKEKRGEPPASRVAEGGHCGKAREGSRCLWKRRFGGGFFFRSGGGRGKKNFNRKWPPKGEKEAIERVILKEWVLGRKKMGSEGGIVQEKVEKKEKHCNRGVEGGNLDRGGKKEYAHWVGRTSRGGDARQREGARFLNGGCCRQKGRL